MDPPAQEWFAGASAFSKAARMATKFRSLLAAALFASACSTGQSLDSAGDVALQTPPSKLALQRVEAAADGSLRITQKPRFEQPMTVVLKLAGDPVAMARSKSPGKRIDAPT